MAEYDIADSDTFAADFGRYVRAQMDLYGPQTSSTVRAFEAGFRSGYEYGRQS